MLLPNFTFGQSCECTNCPRIANAGVTTDLEFEASGATINDLSDPGQGVCGVYIEFAPDHIWTLEMILTSPGGQQVTIIGPPGPGGFFSGSLTWELLFIQCGEIPEPDAGLNPVWNNSTQPISIGSFYNGSYHPFSGCLEDFNTGTVDGTWTLSVNNTNPFNVAFIQDFQVIFCDDDGLDCFLCEADTGSLAAYPDIVACPGDAILEMDLEPDYGVNSPPDTLLYGYTFVIGENDTVLNYDTVPDLSNFGAGTYTVCGLSYLLEDSLEIPSANGSLTLSDLRNDLESILPPFCGALTADCIDVLIQDIDTTFFADTICFGDTLIFNGQSFDTTGQYYFGFSTGGPCGSAQILNVQVLDEIRIDLIETICTGEEYCIDTFCFDMEGQYEVTLSSTQAPFCDSVIHLRLAVDASPIVGRRDTICAGDSIVIKGQVFKTTGEYTILANPLISCDTTINLRLEVIDPIFTFARDTLCAGSTLVFGSDVLDSTGVYDLVFTADNGCDSILQLSLVVLDSIITNIVDTICLGDEYRIGTTELTSTGVYDIVLRSVEECDSLVQVDLTVLDPIIVNLDTVICQGEVVTIGTEEFNETDRYIVNLTSSQDCDSMVILELVVLSPTAIIEPVDLLSCENDTIRLDASNSNGMNLVFEWIDLDNGGIAFSSSPDSSVTFVTLPGTYQLIVTDTLSGTSCTVSNFVGVGGSIDPPQVFTFNDSLSCTDTTVVLNVITLAGGLDFAWDGPGIFNTTIQNPVVSLPGVYTLITTGPNRCKDTSSLTITENVFIPEISIQVTDTFDCATFTVPITASATGQIQSYEWTGPFLGTVATQNLNAFDPGAYQLVVTTANGCAADTIVNVPIDTITPAAMVAGDTLFCGDQNAQISATSLDPNLIYNWQGPGVSSMLPNLLVTMPGIYSLTVTGENACTETYTTEVLIDTLAPILSLLGGTLNCDSLAIDLMSITTDPNLIYSWTGPGTFDTGSPNPRINEDGQFYLTVTAANNCTTSDSIFVSRDTLKPGAFAIGDTLLCDPDSVQIFANSPTFLVDYLWLGPNSFNSTERNPFVSDSGDYVLYITGANGCQSVDTATVFEYLTEPGVYAQGDTITCQDSIAQLLGGSPIPGVTFFWTGPAPFVPTSIQNPTTQIPGLYDLIATGPNGCESRTSVLVDVDFTVPDIAVVGDTLTCSKDSIPLQVLTSTPNVSPSWTGPPVFATNVLEPFVKNPGTYILTLTAANGCTAMDTAFVFENKIEPGAIGVGGTIDCRTDSVQLMGSSISGGMLDYKWTKTGLFVANIPNPKVGEPGEYILEVTGANGCISLDTVQVLEDKIEPGAIALGDSLTCTNDTIPLFGNSSSLGIDFLWEGPGLISSPTDQNPLIDQAGEYILTVTGLNGCTSTDTINIISNIVLPMAFASSPDTLNCNADTITIFGNSPTPGVSFSWTGPGTFSSVDQNPLVTEGGDYFLTVTAPNGCPSFDQVRVELDTLSPVVIATGGTLDCSGAGLQLIGNSSMSNVSYTWTGPGPFLDSVQNPTVFSTGIYLLTVEASNGCIGFDTTLVKENIGAPGALAMGDTLTCFNDTIQLFGTSPTAGVSYSWTGPGIFSSLLQNPMIDSAGQYILTVTGTNFCESRDTIWIAEDFEIPDILALGDTLSCDRDTISLFGNSATPGVTYSWTGPGVFSSPLPFPEVDQEGTYYLTVMASNGCTAQDTVEVVSNVTFPDVSALVNDTINCLQDSVQLFGNSTTTNVTYSWVTPATVSLFDQNPIVYSGGIYILKVEALNGCESSDTIEVLLDTIPPGAMAIGDTLGCGVNASAQLLGNSPTPGVIYSWDGPGTFVKTDQNPIVNEIGEYILTVTAANACVSMDSVMVIEDSSLPGAMTSVDTLFCGIDSVQLMGSSLTTGVSYTWVGPPPFFETIQNPFTSIPGEYVLFVTGPNGCESQQTIDVIQDTISPLLTFVADTLDCLKDSVQIFTTSSVPLNSYNWTSPGVSDPTSPNPFVFTATSYTLSVVGENFCTQTATVQVEESYELPDVSALGDTLNCNQDTIQLQGISSTPGVTYSWTADPFFTSAQQNPTTDQAGEYILAVLAPNGCEAFDTIVIAIDTITPGATASGGVLGCLGGGVLLNGNATGMIDSIGWEGPGGFTSSLSNPNVTLDGVYTFTVTGTNGCQASDTALVVEDINLPGAMITGDTLTCLRDTVQLFGSVNNNPASYAWVGPLLFVSNDQNPEVTRPGVYTLTTTGGNGCTSRESFTVLRDTISPLAIAIGDTLTCKDSILQVIGSTDSLGQLFSWTGPHLFSVLAQSPIVMDTGEYVLTVSGANGCTATDTTQVINEIVLPGALAIGDTINCLKDSIQLLGSSPAATTVTYSWEGPAAFSSMEQNPFVTEGGTYILNVISPAECESFDTVEVVVDTLSPGALAIGDTLDCSGTGVILMGSTTSGIDFQWEGPSVFEDSIANPLVMQSGTYILVVTGENACTSTDTTFVIPDIGVPGASILGDTLNCLQDSIQLFGNTNTGIAFSWVGPSSFVSAETNPFVNTPGTYTLTVTGANVCTSESVFEVIAEIAPPGATAIGDSLECTTDSLQVIGFSPSADVTYAWQDLGSFTSMEQSPTVPGLGTYILTVTGLNGCTSMDTVQVIDNRILPAVAILGDTLNCQDTTVTLEGISLSPGLTFSWEGPNGFSLMDTAIVVDTFGTYILTVLNAQACEAKDTFFVPMDTLSPMAMALGDTLTCGDTLVQLFGNAVGAVLDYNWTSPGAIIYNEQNPIVSESGLYVLEVIGANHCRSKDSTIVAENILEPGAIAMADTLNCTAGPFTLQASAIATGVNYLWEGPSPFLPSTDQFPLINIPGEYFLTVTGANACTSVDSIIVIEDKMSPDISLIGDTLICDPDSIQLFGNSSTPDVSFSWTGPAPFNPTNVQNPFTQTGGLYYLTITAANACTSQDSTLVVEDQIAPQALAIGGTLDCDSLQITLSGNASVSTATYFWTGPLGFTSNVQNPVIDNPGEYILFVTGANQCTDSDTINIIQDATVPGITAIGDTLNCTIDTIQLLGNSPTPVVTYLWTGPGGFSSMQQNPLVGEMGDYQLTVEATNGCKALSTVQVVLDTILPNFQGSGDTLDCNTGEAFLAASSTNPGDVFLWTGPNSFSSNLPNPLVLAEGTYTLVVTAANTCKDSLMVVVIEEPNVPVAEAGLAADLDCDSFETLLDGSASIGDPDLEYLWTNGLNIPLASTDTFWADTVGYYFLQVTNPGNTCSSIDSVLVRIDTISPVAVVDLIGGQSITCSQTSIVLDGTGSMSLDSLYFNWLFGNTSISTEVNPEISEPGIYTLITTNAVNGCVDSTEFEILLDNQIPLVNILPPTMLNCYQDTVFLDASGSDTGPDYNLEWTSNGPAIISGATTPFPEIDQAGTYLLWIENANNGCRDSASVVVTADFEFPLAEAGEGGLLDCHMLSLFLNGIGSSFGTDYTYQWLGAGLLNGANSLTPEINEAGIYTLQVLNENNGCQSEDEVEVLQGNDGPSAAFVDLQAPLCYGDSEGIILIDTVVGGVGPYLYSINDAAYVSWSEFPELSAGSYTISIQDAEGCELDTLFNLLDPLPLLVDLGEDELIQLGEEVDLDPQVPGNPFFDFVWEENSFLACDSCYSQIVKPYRTSTFSIKIEDENGCVAEDQKTVFVEEGNLVFVPSAFSPDGDGTNDFLEIFTSSAVEEIESFLIFDRWGEVVHEQSNFMPGDPGNGWDGRLKGKPMNPAVFVYFAKVKLLNGDIKIFKGSITLMR